MMKNEEMGKELERFESEMKSGDTKGISYKVDLDMESKIKMDYLEEKYGKEKIDRILSEAQISFLDLSSSEVFSRICKIAES